MCQFKSFVCTEKRLHVYVGVDSHEDIIETSELKDDPEKIVRVELIPPDFTLETFKDVDSWKFQVDQDVLPEWFIHEEWETECKNWMKRNILFDDKNIITNQVEVYAGNCKKLIGFGSINILFGTVDRMFDSSTINKMYHNSTVKEMYHNSTVNKMYHNSTVKEMYHNSTVKEMFDSSTINEMWNNSTVNKMYHNSTVKEMFDSSIVNKMYHNSTVKEMYHNSTVNKR